MIAPTVGRIVWFYPNGAGPREPLAAQIAKVISDEFVNIGYLDASGIALNARTVRLCQEGEEPPTSRPYCTWMPYQVGQAKKALAEDPAAV